MKKDDVTAKQNKTNIISNVEFAKYRKRKVILDKTLNLLLARKGYSFEAKKFVTDKGIIDFVVRDVNTNELIFVILIEKKLSTFKYKENWAKVFSDRYVLYGVRWFLRKHNQEDMLFRIDIAEMFQNNKTKKVMAKIYKNPKVIFNDVNINTRKFILKNLKDNTK